MRQKYVLGAEVWNQNVEQGRTGRHHKPEKAFKDGKLSTKQGRCSVNWDAYRYQTWVW